MKFSEQWLRKWVNPTVGLSAITDALSVAGLEVESVTATHPGWEKILIGEITEAVQHPDADKLKVCAVHVGREAPLTIVCGAANARPGIRVAVAVPGAKLPDGMVISERAMRGVTSSGMICSSSELGLAETSEGIMELPLDAPIGTDLEAYLGLDDTVVEVDITPNRGDCLSIAGVAREVSVLFNTSLTLPEIVPVKPVHDHVPTVEVQVAEDCPRYVTRAIKHVTSDAQTPMWMQEALRRCGVRPIHPVVDVTNYVMLELGQPMHAFDASKITQPLCVRKAQTDEPLILLDGTEIQLTEHDCVIADQTHVLALAGVMGGLDSGVSLSTTDIILESAFFNPKRVGPSARQFGLQTDSSYRFERGVDFAGQHLAIERATALLLDIVGGEPGPVVEVTHEKNIPPLPSITLRRDRVFQILGISLSDDKIVRTLSLLGMQWQAIDVGWQVVPPSYRFDIKLEIDLIEELVRIYGLNNMPSRVPKAALMTSYATNPEVVVRSEMSKVLVDRGYQEIISYSFVSHAFQTALAPDVPAWRLLNPISQDMDTMRSNLWTGLLQTLHFNQNRHQNDLKLFEVGKRFVPVDGTMHEQLMIAGVAVGRNAPEQWGLTNTKIDFYDVKADCEALFNSAGKQVSWQRGENPALHPGQQAVCLLDNTPVGTLGVIHPEVAQKLNIKDHPILFEFQLDALAKSDIPHYISISRYPVVRRDLGLVVSESVEFDTILRIIKEICGAQLVKHVVFDIYRGEEVGEGLKNVVLGLIFQDKARTLNDEAINPIIADVVQRLKETVGAQLRDW